MTPGKLSTHTWVGLTWDHFQHEDREAMRELWRTRQSNELARLTDLRLRLLDAIIDLEHTLNTLKGDKAA